MSQKINDYKSTPAMFKILYQENFKKQFRKKMKGSVKQMKESLLCMVIDYSSLGRMCIDCIF